MKALIAITAAVALSGCHRPPSVRQLLDQCELDGAGKDPSPFSGGLAPASYITTCMRAHGWKLTEGALPCDMGSDLTYVVGVVRNPECYAPLDGPQTSN
jgi:hypothetical protein